MNTRQIMLGYYVATAVFLLLDLMLGINIRIAFLDSAPVLRWGYYGICFVCLALMLSRPNWTIVIAAVESLVTLVALILSFGIRTMLMTGAMLEGRASPVTIEEVFNFCLAGGIAYFAYVRGMRELRKRL